MNISEHSPQPAGIQRRRQRRPGTLPWLGVCALILLLDASPAAAEERLITVSQGTDFTVTASHDGRLFIDLAGRLWHLPATGGEALPITPRQELASRPALSPDGHTLAYQSLREGYFQILLTDLDSRQTREITSGSWHHLAPAWSADGRHLALSSNRGGNFGIWDLDLETLALKPLTFETGDERDPAWSPEDGALAYISDTTRGSALMLRTPPGSSRTLIRSQGQLYAPAWRPDGSLISYVAETADGPRLNMVILSSPPVIKILAPGETALPRPAVWSNRDQLFYTADGQIRQREFAIPQAKTIPFQAVLEIRPAKTAPSRRLPDFGTDQPVRALAGFAVLPEGRLIASALGDLWEISTSGEILKQLTDDDWIDREPATPADGRRLAFTSDRGGGNTRIWVQELATGITHALPGGTGDARHPAWSPDGRRLAFLEQSTAGTATGSGRFSLRVHDLSSATTTELARDLSAMSRPAWSADGTRIGLVQGEGASAQLLLIAADRSLTRRRITLPVLAVSGGDAEVQWSPDGRTVLLASDAGIRILPVLDKDLIGADSITLYDGPVESARWLPNTSTVVFSHAGSIGTVTAGEPPHLATVALRWHPPAAPGRTIIRAGRVFDGLSYNYLLNQDVIVEGHRIVAVQPWTPEPPAAGERLIDARNRTVVPGLIDTAVRFDSATESAGRALLAWGITTVQALSPSSIDLRDAAEYWMARGAGPHLLHARFASTAGETNASGISAFLQGAVRLCTGEGHHLEALAASARDSGVPVWSDDWQTALSGLVDVIGPAGSGACSLPAMPRSGMYYQDATGVIIHSGVGLVSGLAEAASQTATQRLHARQRMLSQIGAGGGRIVAGTGVAGTEAGATLHAELRWLVQAGFTPAQALRMATSEAAQAIGLQEDIGSITPGRIADLLIVDGDPLARPRDLARIDSVMISGKIHNLGALTAPSR